MKCSMISVLLNVALLLPATANAVTTTVGDYLADSNQFGYTGTVQNVTQNTNAVAFPTPRDGSVYFTNNVPLTGYNGGNYNQALSNWWQHPQSNQNPGFFQMADGNDDGVIHTGTSATGGWTPNGSLWDFTLTVTGENATYANSYSRLWQPDAGMAWGGTFTSYTYTLTATGMPTTVTNGWRTNTADPTGITGSFDGVFVSTSDVNKNPITNGDTYSVHLDLSKAIWDGTNFNDPVYGYGSTTYSTFGAAVPEPGTIVLLGMAALGALAYAWRRRRS